MNNDFLLNYYDAIRLNFLLCLSVMASLNAAFLLRSIEDMYFLVGMLILVALFHGGSYYFGYKKNGTKFLTFTIAGFCSNFAQLFFKFWKQPFATSYDILQFVLVSLFTIYLLLSYSALLELNKLVQKERLA